MLQILRPRLLRLSNRKFIATAIWGAHQKDGATPSAEFGDCGRIRICPAPSASWYRGPAEYFEAWFVA